ncbi:MAG: ribosome biogenesis GTPase Der [Actinomycetota bacterium]|nr:ribosome biogenesis GTPase Der [Actinomycetota bacterium]
MKDGFNVVSVIGKPNIGKSTLINRICSSKEAIVHEHPMITRDRKYYKTEWNNKIFYILDTGGMNFKPDDRLSLQILLQARKAIDESDIIIFLVNLREPISTADEEIISFLRKTNKKIIFAGNKWDSEKGDYYVEDYLKLGIGYPIKVSAMHGINIGDLLDEITDSLTGEEVNDNASEEPLIPDIAILGKPNSGKSTLFNTLIKEERVIVNEIEGTTRDTIDSILNHDGKNYRFIDTAGLKRNRVVEEDLEYYSKLRTVRIIKEAQIGLVLVDSTTKVSKQDINIINTCLENGTSAIVVFTKTDLSDKEIINNMIEELDRKLYFASYIPFLKISALKNKGIENIFKYIDSILKERVKIISENKLMGIFKQKEQSSYIYVSGKKYKLKFIKQIGTNPPYFLVFSNMDISAKTNIKNYIEKTIRENYEFKGTPIMLKFKY